MGPGRRLSSVDWAMSTRSGTDTTMDRYRGGFVGLPGSLWVGLDMFYAGWTLARTHRR